MLAKTPFRLLPAFWAVFLREALQHVMLDPNTTPIQTLRLYDRGLLASARLDEAFWDSTLSLEEILDLEDPASAIEALSPQELYLTLKSSPSLREHPEVLAYITAEQWIRLNDYDGWVEDELSPIRMFSWLQLCWEVSPTLMAEKFIQLEEEVQIALINPWVRVLTPEEFDQLSQEQQDTLFRFPGDALFYAIQAQDSVIRTTIELLIRALQETDMSYAMRLLYEAAFALPQEADMLAAQFRRARLEEDGFYTAQEASGIFLNLDFLSLSDLHALVDSPLSLTPENRVSSKSQAPLTLDSVLAELSEESRRSWQEGFLKLANLLCSAISVDPSEKQQLRLLLTQGKCLANLGLEFLQTTPSNRLTPLQILFSHTTPTELFRAGLAVVSSLRETALSFLNQIIDTEKTRTLRNHLLSGRFGLALDWCDKNLTGPLEPVQVEILKGLFNRFPAFPQLHNDGKQGTFSLVPVASLADLNCLTHIVTEIFDL